MIVLEVISAILIAFKIMKYTDVSVWVCAAPLIVSMLLRICVAISETLDKDRTK